MAYDESLESRSHSDLACLAMEHSVAGWQAMPRVELIRAISQILNPPRSSKARKMNGHSARASSKNGHSQIKEASNGVKKPAAANGHRSEDHGIARARRRPLGASRILKTSNEHNNGPDSLAAHSHDPFWILV